MSDAEARLVEDFGPFFSLVSTGRRPTRARFLGRLRSWLLRGL